jgi:hypothetical protein
MEPLSFFLDAGFPGLDYTEYIINMNNLVYNINYFMFVLNSEGCQGGSYFWCL